MSRAGARRAADALAQLHGGELVGDRPAPHLEQRFDRCVEAGEGAAGARLERLGEHRASAREVPELPAVRGIAIGDGETGARIGGRHADAYLELVLAGAGGKLANPATSSTASFRKLGTVPPTSVPGPSCAARARLRRMIRIGIRTRAT